LLQTTLLITNGTLHLSATDDMIILYCVLLKMDGLQGLAQ
jgi:hypothetical protein